MRNNEQRHGTGDFHDWPFAECLLYNKHYINVYYINAFTGVLFYFS